MRDLINILTEKGLTAAELAKHEGAYIRQLIQSAGQGSVTLTPDSAVKYGQPSVALDPATIDALQQSLSGTPLPRSPMFVLDDGSAVKGSWGAINKGAEYTGLETKKEYNAGHLAELFMGLAVTAKFFNFGKPISVNELIDMFSYSKISAHTNPKTNKITSNVVFTIIRDIQYPAAIKGRPDQLTFKGVIPGRSAEAFIKQVKVGQFPSDLTAIMASAVKYVNEAPSVANSVQQVQKDPNTNQINVISDGTSDAKMTKADLILTVDGKKINLFSLKTYSSDTLGQISGVGFDQVSRWFNTSFGIDMSRFKTQIESAATPDEGFKILLKLYDVLYPEIEKLVDDQTPGQESAMVQQFAEAAKYHARGGSGEDVEIVKLDDKIKNGNYKILKFSDNLYDAMKNLDLETRLVSGDNSRTIQIWVKPDSSQGMSQANKLCQFRTQKMGESYRNYFESGPMLEQLTQVGTESVQEEEEPPKVYGNEKTLGRKRQR